MRHSEAGLRGGSTRFGDCLLSQTCPEAREQHSGWFDLLSEPLSLCTDHWQTAKALTKAWWCMACWIAEDGGCCLSSLWKKSENEQRLSKCEQTQDPIEARMRQGDTPHSWMQGMVACQAVSLSVWTWAKLRENEWQRHMFCCCYCCCCCCDPGHLSVEEQYDEDGGIYV